MWNWGIRARVEAECGGHAMPVYGLTGTPFRVGGVSFISLEKETPRNERFTSHEDEERLLALADARMKAFIVTMLDTACRPGELQSLQWRQVNLKGKLATVSAWEIQDQGRAPGASDRSCGKSCWRRGKTYPMGSVCRLMPTC